MKRDSIANTLIVALGVCLVCSFFVSLAAVGLKPMQQRNVLLDKKRNILSAAGLLEDSQANVEQLYEDLVRDRIIELESGNDVTEQFLADNNLDKPIDYDQLATAKDDENRLESREDIAGIKGRAPYSHVYLIRQQPDDPQPSMYVFPIRGYGLWSELKGFIALDADLNTIRGLTYYEHQETPGLGGEVDNPNWKVQWQGKQLYGPEGDVQMKLIKNADPGDAHAVDALSGATITGRGVENMLKYWMGDDAFGPYIEQLQAKRSGAESTDE